MMKSFLFVLFMGAISEAFVQPAPRTFLPRATTSRLAMAAADGDTSQVKYNKSTHTLHYVPDVTTIETGPITPEVVDAYRLVNNKGVTIKAMARGANMVVVDIGGTNYVWENREGACYYGGWTDDPEVYPDAFPLKRGLILNGGIRYAAVTAVNRSDRTCRWHESIGYALDLDPRIV